MLSRTMRGALGVAGVAVAVTAVGAASAAQAATAPEGGGRRAAMAPGGLPGACTPVADGYGDAGDLFVLSGGKRLSRLDGGQPSKVERSVTVTGLAAGERLVGIDIRPANGQLYGVGSGSQLYVIDPGTGGAAKVGGPFTPALRGAKFGVDVNPVVDRIRIVSDAGQSLRLNPTTGAVAGEDTALAYAVGDRNAGRTPQVTAAGYTDSAAGAASTALYDIDAARDVLALQGSKPGAMPVVSPNTGQLTTVGSLGLNITRTNGFDIAGTAKGSQFNEADYTAVAAVQAERVPGSVIVRINLKNGRASIRGVVAATLDGLAISPGSPRTVYGLTSENGLFRFERANPAQISTPKPVTGLRPGEKLHGIDVRPATGQLLGLGSSNQLYAINPFTAVATAIGGPFGAALTGARFGFDVNPAADRVRVVSTSGQNLRLNPDTGAVAAVDTDLAYAAGDRNADFRANVVAAGYTNSVAGAASTILYDIDGALDMLAKQDPPNAGTLATVGGLRTDTSGVTAFDIAPDQVALAALQRSGSTASKLHCVDLASGRARLVGPIGDGVSVIGLAVAPRGHRSN